MAAGGCRASLDLIFNDLKVSLQTDLLPSFLAVRQRIPKRARPHGLPAPLVVSLTSYPPRFPTLIHTLRALLQQDTQADAVELWLDEHEASALPRQILALREHGLTIRISEDLKSYSKYVPARRARPDAIIVTADDDAYYRPSWLRELADGYEPGVVVCHRAHHMRLGAEGRPLPYAQWDHNITDRNASRAVVPTGIGGVLYPPNVHYADVLDASRFMALSPNADDIWFYWMGLLAGTRFRKLGTNRPRILWRGSQGAALWRTNGRGGNDRAIGALVEAYGVPALD